MFEVYSGIDYLTSSVLVLHTIDTEIKAKWNNMISELVTFRKYESECESEIRGEVSM